MIYNKIISVVETRKNKMVDEWVAEVRNSERMKIYNSLPDYELKNMISKFIGYLIKFLKSEVSDRELGKYFVEVGKRRNEARFPLCEIHHAVYITKKILWTNILSSSIIDNTLAVYLAMDIITTIHDYFDRGIFYIIRGYVEQQVFTIEEKRILNKEQIKDYFFPGSSFKLDSNIFD